MKRGQIFQVKEINSLIIPPIYKLIDLMKDDVKGHFYAEQLTKCPSPEKKNISLKLKKCLKKNY